MVALVCTEGSGQSILVQRAPEWSALFDRNSGWTGADGIYSIPLSGDDSHGSAAETPTLFVFSDTFIGEVNSEGERLPGSTMVNNTLALLRGGEPDSSAMGFFYARDENGDPQAVFVPETPDASPGDWYWFMDGIAIDGQVHLFSLRMKKGQGGVFDFEIDGTAMISIPRESDEPIADAVQIDVPLYHVPDDGRGEMVFGGAVMANTATAGSPHPDGYIYIYGTQNDPFNKKLLAARLPENFAHPGELRFWDGEGWTQSIDEAAPLAGRVSMEFSVSPLPDGCFILVFQLDTLSPNVAVRIGETPVGPWGQARTIYECPEPAYDADIYTYNAKAHPHLSDPGELLVSYNVNTFDFWDHVRYADIYRPRFIRIRFVPS
jgi:hypothetical protein